MNAYRAERYWGRSEETEEKGWKDWEKDDITWVIEMQSNSDGQVEKLGDVSLIGTLIELGQIPHRHWAVWFKMYWQMFPHAWEGEDVIN